MYYTMITQSCYWISIIILLLVVVLVILDVVRFFDISSVMMDCRWAMESRLIIVVTAILDIVIIVIILVIIILVIVIRVC